MKRKSLSPKEKAQRDMLRYLENLTRRDFFVEAVRTGTTMMAIPTLMKLLFQETAAYGEVSPLAVTCPVVQAHWNGGPGADLHSMPVKEAGAGRTFTELAPTALHGYGIDMDTDGSRTILQGQVVNAFGNRFYNPSGVGNAQATYLDGVLGGAGGATPLTPEEQGKVYECRVAVSSDDDNNTNPCGLNNVFHNVNTLIPNQFRAARLLEAVGVRATETGMGNAGALPDKLPPFIPNNAADVDAQRNYAANIPSTTEADRAKIQAMAEGLRSLASSHANSSASMSAAQKQAIAEAHNKNLTYVNPVIPARDPKLDLAGSIATIWGITAGTGNNDADYRFASGLAHVLGGLTSEGERDINFVGFSEGGYDYHQNVSTTTRQRDNRIGVFDHRCIRSFLAAGENGLLIKTKDGSVSMSRNPADAIVALGDRGNYGTFSMIFVNGNPNIPVTHNRVQLGKVQDNANVDRTTLVGRNDVSAAAIIAANILYLNGMSIANIKTVLGFRNDSDITDNLAFLLG